MHVLKYIATYATEVAATSSAAGRAKEYDNFTIRQTESGRWNLYGIVDE